MLLESVGSFIEIDDVIKDSNILIRYFHFRGQNVDNKMATVLHKDELKESGVIDLNKQYKISVLFEEI